MNQKLQLENAGDAATFTVTEVREVQTKFGDKICVVGTDDNGQSVETSLITDKTVDNQLERIGLTRHTVIGERLTFSRAHNERGKPFWNIDVPAAGGAPIKRMTSPSASTAPATPVTDRTLAQRRDAVASQYLMLWDTVFRHIDNSTGDADVQAVQAAAATIWLSWKDKGIQPDGLDAVKALTPEPAPQVKMPEPSGKRVAPPMNVTVPPARPEDDDLPF